MNEFKRIITVVMDSVGIGEAPDAVEFGDVGSDTLGNIARFMKGLNVPNLERMGLGNIHDVQGVEAQQNDQFAYGKMEEASASKDTMTGHWELMGLYLDERFLTFTETGFPQELLDELTKRTGHKIIGNYSASGTEIIKELGERHMETGEMIVYTSADSVLQIAAHEDTFGLDELYTVSKIAREITMKPEWRVGRIIARPFIGDNANNFTRTANRHDYALKPFGKTALDHLKEGGFDVISVGKIIDIFDGEGITDSNRTVSNEDGMNQTIQLMDRDFTGLMFTNLVDFDALWGHRRDPQGYGDGIEAFDSQLGELLEKVTENDLLIITADHGNDPTFTGTDHTREYVPLLLYSPRLSGSIDLGTRKTFADLGQTICDNFNVRKTTAGESFLDLLVK
jgi:phosphopentomutase